MCRMQWNLDHDLFENRSTLTLDPFDELRWNFVSDDEYTQHAVVVIHLFDRQPGLFQSPVPNPCLSNTRRCPLAHDRS